MTIVEFLHARVEDEYADAARRWIGTGESDDERAFMAEKWAGSMTEAAARLHEQTMHLGVEIVSLCPPFARSWAARYADHPDFDEVWRPCQRHRHPVPGTRRGLTPDMRKSPAHREVSGAFAARGGR